MPGSARRYDLDIQTWVREQFPIEASILDIGAGTGKYRNLLNEFPNVDGVEIFEPYIKRYRLTEMYRDVFHYDAVLLDHGVLRSYDLVILGDVLEHLSVEDARAFLSRIDYDRQTVLIAVPFEYEQGEVDGNPHEVHVQDDLTHARFVERYGDVLPRNLATLALDEQYAIYVAGARVEHSIGEMADLGSGTSRIDLDWLRQRRVVILTPAYGGNVSTEYLGGMLATWAEFGRLQIPIATLRIEGSSHIDKARNQLIAQAMADEDNFTHFLFIDADQGFGPMSILKLLAYDKDVVAAGVRKKTSKIEFALNFLDPDDVELEGSLVEVKSVGTGFMMLSRQAVHAMMNANHPDLYIGDEENEAWAKWHYALFDAGVEEGRFLSEDIRFCRRWRELGGRIYVDVTSSIVHVGKTHYAGALSSILRVKGGRDV